jgi:large subunit ribosomal protein L31
MKPNIHPKNHAITVTCSCGNKFKTHSTLTDDLHIDVCDQCHPFYTGKQKIVDTQGRVERFKQKYGMPGATKPADKDVVKNETDTDKKG